MATMHLVAHLHDTTEGSYLHLEHHDPRWPDLRAEAWHLAEHLPNHQWLEWLGDTPTSEDTNHGV